MLIRILFWQNQAYYESDLEPITNSGGKCQRKKSYFFVENGKTKSRSYQTFFSLFFFFGVKLGHLTINNFFLYVTKMQA